MEDSPIPEIASLQGLAAKRIHGLTRLHIMKKVLFITNLPTPYRIDFYRELGKLCDLTVVIEARRSNDLHFNWNDDNIQTFKLHYLNEGNLNEKKINWSILKYLSKSKFDVIVMSCYHTYTGMLSLAYMKAKHIPYVFETDGGMIAEAESSLKRIYKTTLIKGAKAYFSPSEGSDKYLAYYGANKDIIHRYPFSSLSDADILQHPLYSDEKLSIRKRLGVKEAKMILAVGQFIHRKGFDVLMEAAKDMDRNTGIYIVGGKPTEEYLEMQRKYDLSQVHFEGFKTKDELAEYFKAADLFVLPTREDIWGLVINEAMAYGLPVVTTNKCVSGMELISDKDCLVDIDNPQQLKNIMETLMADDERRERLAVENLTKIKGYTVEKMAEAHIKVFESL